MQPSVLSMSVVVPWPLQSHGLQITFKVLSPALFLL